MGVGSRNLTTQSTDGGGRKERGEVFKIGLTWRKQKGIVSTLTPTMLFTMFMIRPQLEPEEGAEAIPGPLEEPMGHGAGRGHGGGGNDSATPTQGAGLEGLLSSGEGGQSQRTGPPLVPARGLPPEQSFSDPAPNAHVAHTS